MIISEVSEKYGLTQDTIKIDHYDDLETLLPI